MKSLINSEIKLLANVWNIIKRFCVIIIGIRIQCMAVQLWIMGDYRHKSETKTVLAIYLFISYQQCTFKTQRNSIYIQQIVNVVLKERLFKKHDPSEGLRYNNKILYNVCWYIVRENSIKGRKRSAFISLNWRNIEEVLWCAKIWRIKNFGHIYFWKLTSLEHKNFSLNKFCKE